ncbi:hypothetical protein N7497_004795 [Penicillium chrysogenum]|nr:hypothetical protein N7497_004795 [Penicillium chrysogenum]
MENDNQDVFSSRHLLDNHRTSPTPVKSVSRRRSTRGDNPDPETTGEGDKDDKDEVQTPARAGTRTSGRQRKTPKRYEEEAVTPSSRRKPATTPARSARATRSAQKPRQSPMEDEGERGFEEEEEEKEEDDDDDDDMDLDEPSRSPPVVQLQGPDRGETPRNPDLRKPWPQSRKRRRLCLRYQDGLDDLVTMQLQQDLYHDQSETHEPADGSEPLPEYAEKFQALCQTGLEDEMRILSTILLEKLSGKRQIPVRGLESEYQKVHQLIEQTVSVGEGNSMLLLKDHSNDFHVVRLNGFLHTDDRLALREMWRQLGREMHTEDDAAKVSSYADTMATLLALLSHPEELFGASGDPASKTAAKSIVILLDEFDLFVTHPRQTLLYNLFDIAQARKAPIAVIGLTTKVDATEMLEKRVKSRFSHRYTYVPLARSFDTFSDICLGSLDLSDAEMADIADELGSERTLCIDPTHPYPKSQLRKSFASQSLDCPDPAPPFLHIHHIIQSLVIATRFAGSRNAPSSLIRPRKRRVPVAEHGTTGAFLPRRIRRIRSAPDVGKDICFGIGSCCHTRPCLGPRCGQEYWEKLLSWGLVTLVGSGNGTADGQMFRVEISFEEVIESAGSGGVLGQWWRE